ncbi:MAG: hypothetical protein HQL88_00665, partial [Magnetococcales bacterium]|nr:hypothetical protein [Magnetococcales bacterium]
MQQGKMRILTVVAGFLAGTALLGSTPAEAGISGEMLANTCAGCHGT